MKKHNTRVVLFIELFISILCLLSYCALSVGAPEDWMPDPNLRRIVSERLGVETLTIADMQRLHDLVSDGDEIESLEGLQHAIRLEFLHIGRSKISDLTPLAGLMKLHTLKLYNNQISDVSPLSELINLRVLQLQDNFISDITPLTRLTNLEQLLIYGNPLKDIIQLENMPGGTRRCWMDASSYEAPIAERIQNRDFPSMSVRGHMLFENGQNTMEIFSAFDFIFGGSPFHPLQSEKTTWLSAGSINATLRIGRIDELKEIHTELLHRNPNMILLVALDVQNGDPEFYGEDWHGWLRDENGNRLRAIWRKDSKEERWDDLIDFTQPIVINQIVQQAKAVSACGLYDGIWLDHWGEGLRLQGIYTAEEEYAAKDTILRRIRQAVPDDFFILVNANRQKIPRWAPYVNGIYMETGRDFVGKTPGEPEGYTVAGLQQIEDALLWNETNLRKPTLNLLEVEFSRFKPLDAPEARQRNRLFTTMALTHSDAAVIQKHFDEFYWYDFWDAPLGRPIGEKAQLYRNREGLFIREFTNGWAVYNRSGEAQRIQLPASASGWASGVKEKRWHTLPDLDGEIYIKAASRAPADINGDGVVNILDLVIVANAFGEPAGHADVTGDGVVNVLDLVRVANAF